MRNLLTTDQVALRLGVQPATIYAYVSRGILHRTLAADGRTSRFDPGEVDQLARRGRPRREATRRGGIDVSLATAITHIDAERLGYRGHDATVLAEAASFERVAELLWTGVLPAHPLTWPEPTAYADTLRAVRHALPTAATPLDRFAVVAAALAPRCPLRDDLRAPTALVHARLLCMAFVAALPVQQIHAVEPSTVAARLWPRLSPLAPTRPRTQLLDAALVLLADHELATSTMAVRVAASCRANPFAVVLAGLGALHGPLHGSAALAAHRVLLDAAVTGAEPALARALAAGRLHGFGHPVYREQDPRATALLARLHAHAPRRDLAVIDAVAATGARLAATAPNVDFALAALSFATKMPVGATEAIFAIGRTAGWIAHALEEYAEEPLRFRARAIYVVE